MTGLLKLISWLTLAGGILVGSTLASNDFTLVWGVAAVVAGVVWFAVFQAAVQVIDLLEEIAEGVSRRRS